MVSELQKDDAPRSQRHRHVDMLPVQARQHAGGEAVSEQPKQEPMADLAKRIPFKMVSHLNCSNEHVLTYINEPLNIAAVIVTPYRNGNPGKAVKTFGLNEAKAKGFNRLADLFEANPQVSWKADLLYPPGSHGRELMGAAAMARGWAKEMAKKGKP